MCEAKALVVFALALAVTGCASVVSGTSQTLTLDTVPSGADCNLARKGLSIGRVNPTPGAVLVQRTRDDITVTCSREGYQTGTFVNKSGLEGATFGNIILGGVVGVIIDSASGANNKYDATMHITLAPNAPGQEQSPQAQASTPSAQTQAGALSVPAVSKPLPPTAMRPAEFRCPKPGTAVTISTGQQYKFTRADGMRCSYTDENGAERQRYAILVDGLGRLARHDLDALWPLKVGNRIEFRNIELMETNSANASGSYRRDYDESFVVARLESITVPAGSFDTIVLEWREKGIHANARSEALITLWYAPNIGFVVKSSAQIVDRDATDAFVDNLYSGMTYEATRVEVPGEE